MYNEYWKKLKWIFVKKLLSISDSKHGMYILQFVLETFASGLSRLHIKVVSFDIECFQCLNKKHVFSTVHYGFNEYYHIL